MEATLLGEPLNYPLDSLLEAAKSKFPRSSTAYGNSRTAEELVKLTQLTPFFSNGWLIMITVKDEVPAVLKNLNYDRDAVVFIVRNKGEMDKVYESLMGLRIKVGVVDHFSPEEGKVLDYIQSTLKIKRDLAEFLYHRIGKSIGRLSDAIDTLSLYSKVTENLITTIIDKGSGLPLADVFEYLIGQTKPKPDDLKFQPVISRKKVFELLEQYERGSKFLFKFLIENFELYLEVHELASKGIVGLDNYRDYFRENDGKFKCSLWTFRRALESIGDVSYDKLYELYLRCAKLKSEGTNRANLIVLFRTGG